mmetsp:Transcript_102151/g.207808  ORF Transcript_102151/g.207808 Transcript_102151/m.207808 type:complete len:134 (-) Transcript_102151:2832-3233(-)
MHFFRNRNRPRSTFDIKVGRFHLLEVTVHLVTHRRDASRRKTLERLKRQKRKNGNGSANGSANGSSNNNSNATADGLVWGGPSGNDNNNGNNERDAMLAHLDGLLVVRPGLEIPDDGDGDGNNNGGRFDDAVE